MGPALDRPSAPARYGLAVLLVATAVLVTWASQQFGLVSRSAAFLAAILLTGWYAGTGPMVVAMVLSTFAFDFFFLPPNYTVKFHRSNDPYLLWFLLFALLAAWFSAARRRSARLLEEARSALEERVTIRTAELRRSEAYLMAAQELSHTGSWSHRIATGEAWWSDETYRIFGLDRQRGAPDRAQLLELYHPDDREALAQALDAAGHDSLPFELDLRIIRPDSSIRFVHSKGQPVLDKRGVVEVMGVIMDVTDRKRSERALRRARERTLEARYAAMLSERTRLAREIHDTLLQGFTGVGLQLLAVSNRVTGQPETVAALEDVLALAQTTLEDARRAVWDMRSPALADGDVSAALRHAAETGTQGMGLALEYSVEGLPRPLDPEVEGAVFRIAQEAIANAVKHAAAGTLRVKCTYGARRMRIVIADDGRGFTVEPDLRSYGGHWGLLGMQERARQVGASVTLHSAPGQGTRVVLITPYSVRQGSHPPR